MERIAQSRFDAMCEGGEVLVADRRTGRPLVVRTPDGFVLKAFRRRSSWLAERFAPYAQMFEAACVLLAERGIPGPRIAGHFRIEETGVRVLRYPYVPGEPLRSVADADPTILDRLPAFHAQLHEKGVLFRAAHLGNILHAEDGAWSLIDVSGLRGRRGPLGAGDRLRALRHALGYHKDQERFAGPAAEQFMSAYAVSAGLSAGAAARLNRAVQSALA